MEKGILFRISRPYKVFKTLKTAAVVLPGVKGDITIIPERAPTMILLRNGVVQILGAGNQVEDRYFIMGGVADVARNRCAVSTEKAIFFDSIDLEKAERKRDEARYDEDKAYYQMIVDYLRQNPK